MKYTRFQDESSSLKQVANAAFELKYTYLLGDTNFRKHVSNAILDLK